MIRLFIDLADYVTIMLMKDNIIVYYSDLDYTTNTLDVIYARFANIEVEEAIVVMHGYVSERQKQGDLTIQNLKVTESSKDYFALKHLLASLGISKVMFYEFAGLYSELVEEKTLLVDQQDAQFQLLVYTDRFAHTQLCTQESLQQTVISLCNKYDIRKVVDVKNLTNQQLLSFYGNLDKVHDNTILPQLTLFAYMMTKESLSVQVDLSSKILAEQQMQQLKAVPIQQTSQSPIQSVPLAQQSAQLPEQPVPVKKKKKWKGIPTFLSIGLSLILLAGTGACVVGVKVYNRVIADDQTNYKTLNNVYINDNAQLAAYKRMADQFSGKSSNGAADIAALGNIKFMDASDVKINYSNSVVTISGSFKNKKKAGSFIKKIRKQYSNAECSIDKKKSSFVASIILPAV